MTSMDSFVLIATIVAAVCVGVLLVLGVTRRSYNKGYYTRERLSHVTNQLTEQKREREIAVKGEQIGFEKGFEAGRQEAHAELKARFVGLLKQNLSVLEGTATFQIEDDNE